MPAQPLHCRYCRGIFLPVSDQAWTTVQCPHCSAQMMVGECDPATAPGLVSGQEWEPAPEPAENPAVRAQKEIRRTRRLAAGAAAGLGLAVAAVAWVLIGRDPPPPAPPATPSLPHPPAESTDPAATPEVQRETLELARQFLSAPDWQELLPLVTDRERVRGLMEWFYATRPLQPADPNDVRIERIETLEADGQTLRRVQAATSSRAAIWLLLRRDAGVWKVDWEVFSSAAVERWRAFVREPAGTSIELPVLAALKPAGEAWLTRAGTDPGSHKALVLWTLDRASLAAAAMPKDSPLWKSLTDIGFDNAVKMIARVTMVDPRSDPPRVKLDSILQRGWIRGAKTD